MPANPLVCLSLAAFPGMRHHEAAQAAIEGLRAGVIREPLWPLSADHVQLVPQNFGVLDERLADDLMTAYPDTMFRLHANVRVLSEHRISDLSGFKLHQDWFRRAAAISRRFGATGYSAHSGLRAEASLPEMLENARRAADLFGCPVAVEGQYPTKAGEFLVATWDEYREVFESGVPYALDLSHLNILASKTGQQELALVREMLSCDRCIEVHLSDNDGSGDWHQVCAQESWWYPLIKHINSNAVVFSEGNHRRKKEQ